MHLHSDDKIIFCYSCNSMTIYHHRDTHGNSYVDSHCDECGFMEWQNRAVHREKEKWVEFNRDHGIEPNVSKRNA
ncbi:hypothetical protein ACWV26_16440 [Rummeliibacillus sp. JY-2-4R]